MSENKVDCIIIDDEENAHFVLKHFMSKLDHIVLKATFLNAVDAYAYLRTHTIDLVFLDINMPEVDGFSFLEMLKYPPMIIVTTAYTDHAYKSFEYNVVDYLHKPIRFERFVTAVEKAVKWKQIHLEEASVPEYLPVKADDHIQQVPVSDILYIESLGNYAKIYLTDRSLITFSTTKDIEDKLLGTSCVRIHKSYIVNIDKAEKAEGDYILVNGRTLPIGKTYKKHFENALRLNGNH